MFVNNCGSSLTGDVFISCDRQYISLRNFLYPRSKQ